MKTRARQQQQQQTTTNNNSKMSNIYDYKFPHRNIPYFFKTPFYNENLTNLKKALVLTDGSRLTVENVNNQSISIHYPIIVTDSPESIGMTVTLPSVKNSSDEEDGEELDENLAHKKERNGKKKVPKPQEKDTSTIYIIKQIAAVVGERSLVATIDVAKQEENRAKWRFHDLVDYFDDLDCQKYTEVSLALVLSKNNTLQKRQSNNICTNGNFEIINQVSYEFSQTKLKEYIRSPQLVRDIDWTDIAWSTYKQNNS
jgi:hypothetical protein